MGKLPMALVMLCVLALLPACGTRTVLVGKGDPVQIREPVKAKVWVFDKDGKRVESEAVLPVGWFAIDAPESKNE
jgi:hypothetical protein